MKSQPAYRHIFTLQFLDSLLLAMVSFTFLMNIGVAIENLRGTRYIDSFMKDGPLFVVLAIVIAARYVAWLNMPGHIAIFVATASAFGSSIAFDINVQTFVYAATIYASIMSVLKVAMSILSKLRIAR